MTRRETLSNLSRKISSFISGKLASSPDVFFFFILYDPTGSKQVTVNFLFFLDGREAEMGSQMTKEKENQDSERKLGGRGRMSFSVA
ncbi:hypothetical protein F2Q70_00009622 [Brassica cretica]|uniref:Uncharacterized protein n=1 Tax=Brassica cretica TaxID=69181 RepID=A0A8S9M2E0_BRACR|nr:hypothetical protein F2Q68_00002641 [Brassica cretica]KAF2612457.1 hypothetical protein F2Q70_00009622 [Brassica cretica]